MMRRRTPFTSVSTKPMCGKAAGLRSTPGKARSSTRRLSRPAMLMAAHWSLLEVTVTRRSGQTTCSKNSKCIITRAA